MTPYRRLRVGVLTYDCRVPASTSTRSRYGAAVRRPYGGADAAKRIGSAGTAGIFIYLRSKKYEYICICRIDKDTRGAWSLN